MSVTSQERQEWTEDISSPNLQWVSSAPDSADPWLMKKLPQLEAVAVQFLCVQVDTEAAHTLLRCTWYRATIMECESVEPGPAWNTRTIVGPEQTGPAPNLASMQGWGPYPVRILEDIWI